LEHEGGDYAVEEEVIVVATAGEGFEVFAGLGEEGGVSGVLSTEKREGRTHFRGVFGVEFDYYCTLGEIVKLV
jgi:hypothetical protein